MATIQLMTAGELAQLPDDGCRYELMRGELIRMAPAGGRHGRIASRIHVRIATSLDDESQGETYIAEAGYFLARDPDVVLAPDVSYIQKDRVPRGDDEIGFMEVVPDLVVEVISPSDRSRPIMAKLHEYLEAGVQLLWLVDPQEETVSVYAPDQPPVTLTGDAVLDGGDVLPDFRLSLPDIFRQPGD